MRLVLDLDILPFTLDDSRLDTSTLDESVCATHVGATEAAGLLTIPRGGWDSSAALASASLPSHHGRPLLLPPPITACLTGDHIRITPQDLVDPLLHYMQLAIVRNANGNQNSDHAEPWYQRHLHRSRMLVADAAGIILDIGCDEPALSRRLFPQTVRYLGIDPGLGARRELCAVAMAEYLPLPDACMDGVSFLTSLDHVLDYHAAIDEAWRVLKPGGALYLASLVWTERAELTHDSIHFHHFRQFELAGALRNFQIERVTKYSWKGDGHRFGVYLKALKPHA